MGSKKSRARKKNKKIASMNSIKKARSISIWIFIVPFVSVNACLILVTQFHGVFESEADRLYNTIPISMVEHP